MFTMLVVLNADFQETMELPCDNQLLITPMDIAQEIWIQGYLTTEKWIVNSKEVQRITTETTTYKRLYTRILTKETDWKGQKMDLKMGDISKDYRLDIARLISAWFAVTYQKGFATISLTGWIFIGL